MPIGLYSGATLTFCRRLLMVALAVGLLLDPDAGTTAVVGDASFVEDAGLVTFRSPAVVSGENPGLPDSMLGRLGVPSPSMTPRRKVILIGIDGLRPSALERAMTQGLTPNLAELAASGTYCWNASVSDLTFSGPGWTDLLSGVHRDKHRVETNSVTGNKFSNSDQDQYPDLLAICKSLDPGLRTARWTTWSPLSVTRTPGGTDYNFFREYSQDGDRLVTEDAVRFFAEDDADVSFFYLGDVDIQGHASGFHPRIGNYLAEIASTDQLIGDLLQSIRNRTGYVS